MQTYLLILFIVALALAPLWHFMPSKRQRKAARMREYAAVQGLFVEFRKLPGAETVAGLSPSAKGMVIYYGKRLPAARDDRVLSGNWVVGNDGWRSVGKRLPIPAEFQQLPEGILGAGVDSSSCGIYWTEAIGQQGETSAEEQIVGQIRQVLESWSETIMR